MNFRIASESDSGRIMELIIDAQEHLKELKIDQWQDGYPDLATISKDIAGGTGYVLTDTEAVIGYLCVSFDGEETYAVIDGQWRSLQPYAVVHRMAIDRAYRGKGLAARMLEFAETLCGQKDIHSIKIDTHSENLAMRHLLTKNFYEYCGIIQFNNSDRMAFEKIF